MIMSKAYQYCKLIFLSLLVLASFRSAAQDSHLSQFYASPILLSPALTGMQDKGDIRVASQFRNQWSSVTNKIATSTLAVDMPVKEKWGVGGYLMNYDAAQSYNVLNFALSGAYDIASLHQKKHKIIMGLQLGFIYKSTTNDKLVFDNQYSNGTFDTDIPNGESIPRLSTIMPDVNYGLSYINTDHAKKFQPYASISVFHLTHPKESFLKRNDSRLPLRYVFCAGEKILASEEVILEPRLLLMRQRNATEFNVGMSGEYIVQPNTVSVLAGCYYRYGDAIIPTIGVDYKSIILRASYDINISSLKAYSRGRGGIEFSLVFIGGKQHHRGNAK